MADIIYELRHEHCNFRQLIGLMHVRFNEFSHQRTSDCEWLLDAALLIKRYHNAVHQPVEDLFLERLLARTGKAHELLRPFLRGNHQDFADHSWMFINALNSVINGAVLPRNTLVTLGEKAIRDLDRQITFEERAIFPFGRRLLSGDDWLEIGRKIENLHSTTLESQLLHEYISLKKRAGLSAAH